MAASGAPRQGRCLAGAPDYLPPMPDLVPLDLCLARALGGIAPVAPVLLDPALACGHVVAADVVVPRDLPAASEALRAGVAVAALDLVGAAPASPVMLGAAVRVRPGAALPPGMDAVLPEDGIDGPPGLPEAIRPASPGEGVRRAGHDARRGDPILRAGARLGPRHAFIATLAGIEAVAVRRPRVRVAMPDPAQSHMVEATMARLGGLIVAGGAADLVLRPAAGDAARLALAPAETAWLCREGGALVLELPRRFDAMAAALWALGLPAMAALAGARPLTETRPLARKITSAVGMAEVVLLAEDGAAWAPQPAGVVTLAGLAAARAIAIIPPQSEGLPAGATLAAHPLDLPFG